MTLRISTGLRQALLDLRAVPTNLMTATTISFGDGTGAGGNDQILDSGNNLASNVEGDIITVPGCTTHIVTSQILAVAAGAVEIAAGLLTTEAAGDQVILATARGGSWADIFRQGVLRIFTGTQPTDPDAVETGTLLVEISQASAAFVSGTEENGLLFGAAAAGVLAKESGDVWSGEAVASGTAGWFRFYPNDVDGNDGASTTAKRFDGAVATSGAQINMTNTSITSGGTTTIDTVGITLPAS